MSFKPHSIITTARVAANNIATPRQVPIANTYLHNTYANRQTQQIWHTAGTFRNLRVFVSQNNAGGASTVTARKNSTASLLAVSIPASTTGQFTDLVDEMTISAGDLLDYELVRGSTGTTSFTPERIDIQFYTGGAVVQKFSNAPYTTFTFSNTTRYQAIMGENNSTGSLADNTRGMRTQLNTVRWKNLVVQVISNLRTVPFTVKFRKNTVTVGNQQVIIPATTTGTFSDLVNVDETDMTQPMYQYEGGAGTQAINFIPSVECESTPYHWTGFSLDPTNFTFNGTRYQRCFSAAATVATTETDSRFQTQMDSNGIITGADAFFTNNAKSGTTTVTLRINQQDTSLVITIPAGSFNLHSDFTDLIPYKKGDLINWKIVTTTTGNLNCRWLTLSILQNSGKPATITVL
jgi:hypothetical protein